jgi:5,10-methylenetetrahydromethanopterin reductase
MRKMQFGTAIYAREIPAYLEWCRAAEGFGFDFLGYGDSATLWMDPFVILSLLAQNTKRARIGTAVTNPVTRHPAVMASGLGALQHLSDGRLFCGIGGGDSGIYNSGLKPAKLAELEEYCRALSDLTNGLEATYHGVKLKLQWKPRHVPVWIAAEGPKTLQLAGRIADGVIIGTGLTEDVIKDSIRQVEIGARSAGRNPDNIEKWWMVKLQFAANERQGWKDLAFTLASSANHALRFTFDGKFVPPEYHEPIRTLHREYAQHQHADFRNPGHNAALVEKLGLTEFLGRRFSFCGPSDRIVEQIRRAADWGAKNLFVTQLFQDQIGFMRRLSEEVFPAFYS